MRPGIRITLCALVASFTAHAASSGSGASALTPTGPVTVTADRAEFDKRGMMIYLGNVRLSSDSLSLSGDKLVLQQFDSGQYAAQVDGAPALLEHAGISNKTGPSAITIRAEATRLNYDTRSGVVDIVGKAHMTRGQDQIDGDNIRYNVAARRIEAAGGIGGQVKIVIQPPAQKPATNP